MIKRRVRTTIAFLGLLVVAPMSFALPVGLTITEDFDIGTGVGNYDVAVAADAGFYLVGFGVSNFSSTAYVDTIGNDSIACDFNPNPLPGYFGNWCYGPKTLTAGNWDSEIAYFDDVEGAQTFQDTFGDFSDNVLPGETTINWYESLDGALGPGDSEDFFLYLADLPASLALGITSDENTGELSFFSNQPLTPIPLPAAVWFFVSALGGLIVAKRKTA